MRKPHKWSVNAVAKMLKVEKEKSEMKASPTFCAKFSDGETTRMSTHCPDGLDPARGIILSRAAYTSRKKAAPPEIVEAHFETPDGVLLKQYSPDEILRHSKPKTGSARRRTKVAQKERA